MQEIRNPSSKTFNFAITKKTHHIMFVQSDHYATVQFKSTGNKNRYEKTVRSKEKKSKNGHRDENYGAKVKEDE